MNHTKETEHTGENPERVQRSGIGRRELLKGLAGLPIIGVFAYELIRKVSKDRRTKNSVLSELGIEEKLPSVTPKTTFKKPGDLLRVGIIGFGIRGKQLARTLGFAHPEWIAEEDEQRKGDPLDTTLKDWLEQEDLNVKLAGICDVFDDRAVQGVETSRCEIRPSGAPAFQGAKRFLRYQDMLASDEIDAVMIATPDFHHARMAIDSLKAGKHIYLEKCMTRTDEEVFKLEKAVKQSGVVFQVGHQYPQNATYIKARELIEKNILGKITIVETTTNRNTKHGAWVRHLDGNGHPKPGDPKSIDWPQWLGERPSVPFDIDRYYNWTKYWDYATGLSGQLMCHEIDAVNQILKVGVPDSCMASGGIYYHDDGREIPDTFHAVFEFDDYDLTLIYSATLANARNRGRVFMGHDASMEVGGRLVVTADPDSTRYQEKIEDGIIDTTLPLLTFRPGQKEVDAVTSASEKYYASRGLIYTYKDGKRQDVTYLHVKEWIEAIRNGTPLSCPFEKGFEVTMACHMATRSFLEQRRVKWDRVRRRIV